jgi:hypothetical protein
LHIQFAQDGGETPSGLALQIKDLEAIEDLKDDIELWRDYENKFFQIERLLAEQQGASIGNDFGIDFIEMEYPTSTQEQILRDDWDLRNGQTTLAKIMVRDNKDLNIEQAQLIVNENMSINKIEEDNKVVGEMDKEEING